MADQWSLNRANFEGRWQGSAAWFERDGDRPINWVQPTRVIDPTTYAISFSEPDLGLWDGSGLFFAPGGVAQYPISRDTYNNGGGCWQFPGAGGQSSLHLDPHRSRFGHEINLFHERSRSMLVLIWTFIGTCWRLQVAGAVRFSCATAVLPERQPVKRTTPEALLNSLRGWSGVVERLIPQPGVDGVVRLGDVISFEPDRFLLHPLSTVMPNGLVFSVPEQLPTRSFRLEIGGLLGPVLFQHVSIVFDEKGDLTSWERVLFRPVQP